MDYIQKVGGCAVDNSLNKWNTIKNTLMPFYGVSFIISVPLMRGYILLELWNNLKGFLGIFLIIIVGLLVLDYISVKFVTSIFYTVISGAKSFLSQVFIMADIVMWGFFVLSLTSVLPSLISFFMPDLSISLLPCTGLTGCINKGQLLIENPNLLTMLILGLGSFYFIRGGLRRF